MALLLSVMLGPFGHLLAQWQMLIEILSVISMVLGALAAIGQTNIKRLMAYSSIGHMGYALMGLAAGTEAGVQATLVYLAIYVVMSFGAFACIIAMRRRGPGGGDHRGSRRPLQRRNRASLWRSRSSCGPWPASRRSPASSASSTSSPPPSMPGCDTAGRHRRADQRHRRLLLSARHQGDVFRRRHARFRQDRPRRALRHGRRRGRHRLFVFIPGPLVAAADAAAKALMG